MIHLVFLSLDRNTYYIPLGCIYNVCLYVGPCKILPTLLALPRRPYRVSLSEKFIARIVFLHCILLGASSPSLSLYRWTPSLVCFFFAGHCDRQQRKCFSWMRALTLKREKLKKNKKSGWEKKGKEISILPRDLVWHARDKR